MSASASIPARRARCAVADRFERVQQAIGRVVQLVLLEPLHAGEAAGRDVARVGPDRHDALALDVDLEPAQRLADPAKGRVRVGHRGNL
jgi:hypothetical protein